MTSFFEAVDITGIEMYHTIGVWPTLEDALAAFADCQDPKDIPGSDGYDCDYEHEGVCTVEIRERPFGWGGIGIPKATLRWENVYDEAADEFKWRRTE